MFRQEQVLLTPPLLLLVIVELAIVLSASVPSIRSGGRCTLELLTTRAWRGGCHSPLKWEQEWPRVGFLKGPGDAFPLQAVLFFFFGSRRGEEQSTHNRTHRRVTLLISPLSSHGSILSRDWGACPSCPNAHLKSQCRLRYHSQQGQKEHKGLIGSFITIS